MLKAHCMKSRATTLYFFEDPSGNRLEICYREPTHQGPLSS